MSKGLVLARMDLPIPIAGLAHLGIFVRDPDGNVLELHQRT